MKQTVKNVRQSTGEAPDAFADFQAKGGTGEDPTGNLARAIADAREAMSDLAENTEALKVVSSSEDSSRSEDSMISIA